jgi:hypothetical protein
MRGKQRAIFSTIATLFMILLLSTSIAPMTASVTSSQTNLGDINREAPLQSEMTFTSGETISFTSTESMTISTGNTMQVWSGVEMNFTSTIRMQFMEVAPDGVLVQCDWLLVTTPAGYLPDPCSWWEVLDPTTGKPLGEFHVDQTNGVDQFHIDNTWPGPIPVPIGLQLTAVRKIDIIEPCRYFEVHWPAHWYPAPCTWWELVDPETGELTGIEFHVDWTNESCEFHIDEVIPGPYTLPFPWYMLKARLKIPGLTPCDYLVVEEPSEWYPAPCTWWEVIDPFSGELTGIEFHVDWTNESCEFHIDDVWPSPFDFPVPGVPFFEAVEKVTNISRCDWFIIEDPIGYTPEPCSWWEVLDPSGEATGIEFHIDEAIPGSFHVDQVTPEDPSTIPWYPPTVTITVVKKIDTITQCDWFKVDDPTTTPEPCSWWKIIWPSYLADVEFHVDDSTGDGSFHIDFADPNTISPPEYEIIAEKKIDTLQPCDWFVVIDPPTGWLPSPCTWWRVTWPLEWAGVEFHVDANNGVDMFHIDTPTDPPPTLTPPPWNVTAVQFEPELPWYMKPPYPDYARSGMPDFDQRQLGTYWWNQTGVWDHCGPVAVANSLWWLDSKFEPNTTPPPAIIDNFPLVQAYGAWDDHDPRNVPPLVEHLAYLMDTNGRRTGLFHLGTDVFDMQAGITHYLSWSGANPLGDVDGNGIVDATDQAIVNTAMGTVPGVPGWDLRADIFPVTTTYPPVADNIIDLNDLALVTANLGQTGRFYEHTQLAPDWGFIVEQVMMSQDVELLLVPWYFDPGLQEWYRYDEGAHFVTVAGLNATTMEIVFSDPIRDNAEAGGPGDVPIPHAHTLPEPPYVTHNNASLVSHDMYHVIVEPCPGGPLTIPDYHGGAIPPPGTFPEWMIQIEAAVVTCPYEVEVHDVAVTNITTSKTGCTPAETIGEGFTIDINVTVENQGGFLETFNVIVQANATTIGTQSCTLNPAEIQTLTFTWNTTGFAYGNYSISATATPVPLETDLSDNTMVYGWSFLTLAGDVDGDHDVDIFDIVRMSGIYGVKKPDPRYDPNCDMDDDGDIDIFDIVAAAGNYGKSW